MNSVYPKLIIGIVILNFIGIGFHWINVMYNLQKSTKDLDDFLIYVE